MSQSLSNAKRLLRDAVLLNDHGRHASAFALAVLGLEEIRKVIPKRWNLPDSERRLHLSKQMAVSSLLIMDDAVRKVQQEVSGPSEFTPDVRERIARAVVDGEAGHFSQLVTSRRNETVRPLQ